MNTIISTCSIKTAGKLLLALCYLLSFTAHALDNPGHDHKHQHEHTHKEHKHEEHEHQEHDTEHHEAHVHGEAVLQLIQEDSELLLTFNSAAGNLLGFEHAPQTEEQQQKMVETEKQLGNASTLFQLIGGECRLYEQQSNSQKLFGEHDKEQHKNINSEYHFHCHKPETLDSIQIKLMTAFPALETLDIEWIIAGRQGTRSLNHQNGTISFK
ncbi:ZrgA family zinc uptake protein [Pseudoteredinibacter isoporae]|uniref:DUF2796 domain-containing protein n=1 Tax=Pseudoteredinibacter isoporae TaxID=570281 RepID=A0A7X0MWJ5_9GAMM|nr:DUF2796 domain-containing protein [Pseudoteredinibacter isoporae]MBB6522240.1 hypothetical protein [Pseudoteredinibacter isoporae]NHO87774.1 DUF2796 domain-containing protein [Pseudoteredinibacter isoporae]NIB23895.1 DUF2796 domain-containing protein [Pseudoteredinibacter isoporae]